MPPPNLSDISALRGRIGSAEAEIARAGREIDRLRRQRELAARGGASADEVQRLGEAEAAALRRQREQRRERSALGAQLGGLVAAGARGRLDDDLSAFVRTPDMSVALLERAVPVALLPVRLETRFDGGTKLHVRIYPDQIHLRQHDDDMTAAEVAAGQRYWNKAWADAAAAADAWQSLLVEGAPERSAFIVDRMRPTNIEARGTAAAPVFPDVEVVERRTPANAQATLLPSRWRVTLIGHDGERMLSKWAPHAVPDRLGVSPFGNLLAETADAPPGELAIDDEARWLVDFSRAAELGMALTIDESELERGRFADGIARLVAVGVDWSRTPDEASDLLVDHLCAHGYSDGFAFLEHGHATNNTSNGNSGYRSSGRERGAAFAALPPAEAAAHSAAATLGHALGASDASRFARFAGGESRYEHTASQVHAALYGASFGFFFTEVLYPVIKRASFRDIREHVQRCLRPAGPCAPLRVGRQPYGVIPVLSTPVAWRWKDELESLPPGFSRTLATTLAGIRLWVEGVTPDERVLDKLVTMAAPPPGAEPHVMLAELLKQAPLATGAKVRPIGGAASLHITGAQLAKAEEAHRNVVNAILGAAGVQGLIHVDDDGEFRSPLIRELFAPRKPEYSLGSLPWVAGNLDDAQAIPKAVAKVRERIQAAAGDVRNTKSFLAVAASDADTLFEALLLLSATFEYWRAAEEYVRRPEFDAKFDGALLTELSGIGTPTPAAAGRTRVQTPRQLLQLRAGALDDASPVSLLSKVHAEMFALQEPTLRDAREFHAALDALVDRPAREVDHALRGLMDAGSHRLDAWITSVATRRLQAQRQSRPRGVHIGGYGFVHDLKPDVTPDSDGYIHVPSTDHAVMAAVLRAAHLANRDDQPESFAVSLTSERVRHALQLSDGMAHGQRASALLGYRFERGLIEGRHQARYINAFRKFAPHPADSAAVSGAQESIAARDVVDGQTLAEKWHKERDAIFDVIGTLTEPPGTVAAQDRDALRAHLDGLVRLADAFGDLWMGESVYQLARGNTERQAAAIAVMDRQERPPEALSVQTPRKCWGYAQRVAWTLPAQSQAVGWPVDIVARTEPGANAIAAALMGDAQRFRIAARALGPDGAVLPDIELPALGLEEAGLSPLALAMLSLPSSRDEPTRLEQHLAIVIARRGGLPEGAGVALELAAAPGSAPEAIGPAGLLALANAVREALFDRRALSQRDFSPPTGEVPEGVDPAPVVERAAALEEELAACEAALATALTASAAPDIDALPAAFLRASGVIPVAPWALTPAARRAPVEALVDEGRAVQAALSRLLQQWREAVVPAPVSGDDGPQAAIDATLELAATRIRLVFGAGFPVLPPFSIAPALMAPLAASWADQQALLQPSKLAVVQWIRTMSLVRTGVRALAGALDAAAWTGNMAAGLGDGRVAQWPHAAGRRWVALPFDGGRPDDVRLSTVLFGALPEADQPTIGVLLDEWTEAIPEAKTTTSVAFQYDAPGARPPQAICLAVDAGIAPEGWTADALVDTVNEMFDLSRLRLLKPADVRGAGAMLPTMFIPQNLSSEMPSLDLLGISALRAGSHRVEGLLGKG